MRRGAWEAELLAMGRAGAVHQGGKTAEVGADAGKLVTVLKVFGLEVVGLRICVSSVNREDLDGRWRGKSFDVRVDQGAVQFDACDQNAKAKPSGAAR